MVAFLRLKPGFLKNGEAGKGILSRWYPATLAKRIRDIALVKKLRFERDARSMFSLVIRMSMTSCFY